ncbi:class I SAM-dependent methyltransferase [Luteimonas sp. JM171]|uniref:class I SAM-dependent methyltransferase n=1 Tax=Luteimonas sp. JM171 TaxID=1896164 RepID=UPI0012F9649F|nr:class I SAM-dependent methyltransferase [Luteimonas sp. JM171]
MSIVECGSGASSVWMARALAKANGGVITSLEHDQEFCASLSAVLSDGKLEDRAKVLWAPLIEQEIDGQVYAWYDLSKFAVKEIDLLVVDGPPGKLGPTARFPALPILIGALRQGAFIVVDDIDRKDERVMVRRWLHRHPSIEPVCPIGPRTRLLRVGSK